MLRPFCEIAFLELPAFRHTDCREYDRFIRPFLRAKAGLENLETICVMREPFSWLISWYRFRARIELRNPKHPSHKNSTVGIPFPEFIEAVISPNPPSFATVGSQFSFMKNDAEKVGVDKVFLYDNMDDLVEYMSQKIGQRLRLKSLTVSPKRVYRSSIAQWASRINQEIRSRANLPHSSAVRQADYEISDDLYASLRKFMSSDFELYETLKNSLKRS